MHIRPKLFLLIFAIALASLLLLSMFSYWQNTRESSLRDNLQRDADWIALRIDFALSEREASLIQLARTGVVREYFRCHPPELDFRKEPLSLRTPSRFSQNATSVEDADPLNNRLKRLSNCGPYAANNSLPNDLQAIITTFLITNQKYHGQISGLNMVGESLFRATITAADPQEQKETPAITLQTQNLPPNNGGPESIGGDLKFIGARDGTPLSTLIERGPIGPALRFTVPVLGSEPAVVVGALVVELKLDQLFKEQASDVVGALNGAPTGMETSRVVIVVHHDGQIYYQSNKTLNYQSVASAMPDFKPVAEAMMAGGTGAMFYESSNHDRWLASYRPLGQLDLALAVATDYTNALQPARRALLVNILASLLIAFVAALAMTLIGQQRSGSLERLTQGAVAIARGRLDQELVVSSDENRLLADSMNIVTARLREQLAREAESRQFEAFMRLSAILIHDLKNTITALSLGVSNMERQFDRAEFRADAMSSLKEATKKLQNLVNKLSEPVNTMSGEHQRPRPTDLVPLIQRVLKSMVPDSAGPHEIESHLPDNLIVVVEPDRMEKIIENLVINSLEAMGPNKGKMTIAAGAAGLGQVFFSVSDTGPGMSRDFQERRLFHPFATTKQRGVGLGLYTCREVVRAHGGSIEVKSEAGVGTTFRVVLPSGQTGEQ